MQERGSGRVESWLGRVESWLKPALHWQTTSSAVFEHAVSCVCVPTYESGSESKSHGVQGRQLEPPAAENVPKLQGVQTEPSTSTVAAPVTIGWSGGGLLGCEKPALHWQTTVYTTSFPSSQSVPGTGVCVRALQTEQSAHSVFSAGEYWPAVQATQELALAAEDKVP